MSLCFRRLHCKQTSNGYFPTCYFSEKGFILSRLLMACFCIMFLRIGSAGSFFFSARAVMLCHSCSVLVSRSQLLDSLPSSFSYISLNSWCVVPLPTEPLFWESYFGAQVLPDANSRVMCCYTRLGYLLLLCLLCEGCSLLHGCCRSFFRIVFGISCSWVQSLLLFSCACCLLWG
jgi:hypothetical protein